MNRDAELRPSIEEVIQRIEKWKDINFDEIVGNEIESFFEQLRNKFPVLENKPEKEKVREMFESFRLEFEDKFHSHENYV